MLEKELKKKDTIFVVNDDCCAAVFYEGKVVHGACDGDMSSCCGGFRKYKGVNIGDWDGESELARAVDSVLLKKGKILKRKWYLYLMKNCMNI